MSVQKPIEEFLTLSQNIPIIDVRTPAEFEQGHIPGAFNIPLFTNEERKIVGTLYKQEGREIAILKGLELVGPKLKTIVKEVERVANGKLEEWKNGSKNSELETLNLKPKTVLVHCWRGGMRSSSVAWLLALCGYEVFTLKGGYKFFRRFVLETFSQKRNFLILGGKTGSGKTYVLQELIALGEDVIDLEKIAHHKGSSFGSLGEEKQPSQEQFENILAMQLHKINVEKKIWLEDESRMVGHKSIPAGMWEQMRTTEVLYIDIPFEERVKHLVKDYGKFSKEELITATERIKKRLGGMQAKQAIEAINNNDLKTACEISLSYYDKAYEHGITQREKQSVKKISFDKMDFKEIAEKLVHEKNGRN